VIRCDICDSRIVVGGLERGPHRFCSRRCMLQGELLPAAAAIPEERLAPEVRAIHQGRCPRCHGPGPVDVRLSYRVWSVLLFTSWESRPAVCCAACGAKARLASALFCLAFGWWGVPWGPIMTPIQLARNGKALRARSNPYAPSHALRRMVALSLAAGAAEARNGDAEAPRPSTTVHSGERA
jgi:hypothetical protein